MKTIQRTRSFLDKLNLETSDYLNEGRVFEVPIDPEHELRKLGMCGTLRPYLPEGALITRAGGAAEMIEDAGKSES